MLLGLSRMIPRLHAAAVATVPSRARLVALLVLPLSVLAQADDAHVPGELIVKFKQEASVLGVQQALAARPGLRTLGEGLHRIETRPGETVEQVILELEALPEVEYAEPNYISQLQQLSPPNDPQFGNQWALRNTGQSLPIQQQFTGQPGADISALAAWQITTGSQEVVVAVIDSGIDRDHPDLSANLWRNSAGHIGRDFIDFDNDPNDASGHGTRMAGIIGARGNNGTGIAGVSWQVSMMVLRVFDSSGRGTVADIAAAIDYAIVNRARIINASFGQRRAQISRVEYEAIQKAANAGILFVAAACNNGSDNDINSAPQFPCYPASYDLPNIISVAATDNADALMLQSNYGATTVDLGAPGEDILTTTPRTGASIPYIYVSGTSASAAFVSGAAALLLAQNPALDAGLMRDALLQNVDPAPNLAGRTVTGGRLNVARALGSEAALEQATPGRSTATNGSSGGSGWFELLALLTCLLLLRGARMRGHRAPARTK